MILPSAKLCKFSHMDLPRSIQEEGEVTLELMECSPQVTIAVWMSLSVTQPRQPCVQRTSCNYGVLLAALKSPSI